MTTIIYKDGILGADSMIGQGDLILPCHKTKVHKLNNGSIVGIAGESDYTDLISLLEEKEIPTRKDVLDLMLDFEALLVTKDKKFFTISGYKKDDSRESYSAQIIEMKVDFYATGSGMKYALGALKMGASIEKALEVACFFDKNTAPPFDFISLN